MHYIAPYDSKLDTVLQVLVLGGCSLNRFYTSEGIRNRDGQTIHSGPQLFCETTVHVNTY